MMCVIASKGLSSLIALCCLLSLCLTALPIIQSYHVSLPLLCVEFGGLLLHHIDMFIYTACLSLLTCDLLPRYLSTQLYWSHDSLETFVIQSHSTSRHPIKFSYTSILHLVCHMLFPFKKRSSFVVMSLHYMYKWYEWYMIQSRSIATFTRFYYHHLLALVAK